LKTVIWIGIPEAQVLCEGSYASERVARLIAEPDLTFMQGRNAITAVRLNDTVVGIGHPVDPELAPALADPGMRKVALSIITDAMHGMGIRGPVKVCIHAA
jgi:hypothetical protein